jgi:hypothetical protein
MAIPVFVDGNPVFASDANIWFVPLYAEKTSGFTATSNTTLANDPQLVLPLAANAAYRMEIFLWYDGGTLGASDLKMQIVLPAGGGYNIQILGYNGAGNDTERLSWQTGSGPFIFGTEGTGTPRGVTVKGRVSTAGTAGNLQIQFAQNTSSATTTTVHSQSYLELNRRI